jgi:D-alanyl-D-alanine carboxypeptidase (penicillin-binding protein 5/6)
MKQKIRDKRKIAGKTAVLVLVIMFVLQSFSAGGEVFAAEKTGRAESLAQPSSAPSAVSRAEMREADADMLNLRIEKTAATTTDPLGLTAESAMVYCENTGQTIYVKNIDKKLYPYSITKLMTALLVVQKCPLDKKVTVSEDAASQGDSTIHLKKGEVVTVEELLYGALLNSGNDAAYALGEAACGTGNMKEFLQLMNQTAENIGCSHTHFSNPNGISSKNNYTTASDFMKIARVALANDTVRKIAGTKRYHMTATNKSSGRTFINHCSLVLRKGSTGVIAGKTGNWKGKGSSIAAVYNKNGLELCIVVLNDTELKRTSDVNKLISYARQKVKGICAVKQGKNVGKVHVNGGAKTSLKVYTAENGYAYLPKEGSKKLIKGKAEIDQGLKAPVKAGQEVGSYKIYVNGELVNSIPLVVSEGTETGWFPSKFGISNFATVVISVILIILCICGIGIAAARAKARKRRKLERKRKIERLARRKMLEEKEKDERGWWF